MRTAILMPDEDGRSNRRMSRNYGKYKNVEKSKNGEFSFHVDPETNQMIDIICKYSNRNKTRLCREVLRKWAMQEFEKAFSDTHQSRLDI